VKLLDQILGYKHAHTYKNIAGNQKNMSTGNVNSTKDLINAFGGSRRASNANDKAPAPPTNFASLYQHKRGSTDAGAAARRASFADQSAPKGALGKWWDGIVKGN